MSLTVVDYDSNGEEEDGVELQHRPRSTSPTATTSVRPVTPEHRNTNPPASVIQNRHEGEAELVPVNHNAAFNPNHLSQSFFNTSNEAPSPQTQSESESQLAGNPLRSYASTDALMMSSPQKPPMTGDALQTANSFTVNGRAVGEDVDSPRRTHMKELYSFFFEGSEFLSLQKRYLQLLSGEEDPHLFREVPPSSLSPTSALDPPSTSVNRNVSTVRVVLMMVVIFCDVILRSISEVFTLNNPITGVLMLVGLGLSDGLLPVFAVGGAAVQNLTALLVFGVKMESQEFLLGLHGYDGVLVAASLRTFLNGSHWLLIAFLAITGCFVVEVVRSSLIKVLEPVKLPPLTASFCFVSLCILVVEPRLVGSSELHSPVPPVLPSVIFSDSGEASLVQVITKSFFSSMGQIIFIGNWIGGVVAFLGFLVASRSLALAAVLSSGIALTLSLLLVKDGNNNVIEAGLLGYNPVLTACAMASGAISFRDKVNRTTKTKLIDQVLKPQLSALVAFMLQFVMAEVLPQLPVMTTPFVFTTWICLPALMATS